jgi:hypothetical protein
MNTNFRLQGFCELTYLSSTHVKFNPSKDYGLYLVKDTKYP